MMSCGSSKPLANQINSGIFACDMALLTTVEEARLHLKRTLNYLVGKTVGGDYPYPAVGGMYYTVNKTGNDDQGLGQGIIPDLQTLKNGWHPSPLQPNAVESALGYAISARDSAANGLQELTDLKKLQQSAKDVQSELQQALAAVLA